MSVPALNGDESSPVSLEALGLELALQTSGSAEADFGTALDEAGAKLLFDIHVAAAGGEDYVAAVTVGDGPERQLLIVTRPSSGAVSIEPAETSTSPIARLAPAFADVMERWREAA